MKNTKKSLLLSGASLVLSAALLAGSTFAWFTDSVTNSGNKVQAGTLSIDAVAYDLADSGKNSFTIEGVNGGETFYFKEKGQDLKTDKDPIISEENWEPGVSSAKLLQVTNSGTLATKIKVDFTVLEKDLTNALWFDFVQVDENGQISGKFTRRPMSTLETFADNLELPLSADKSVQFILVYGMNEEAGNEYQGKSFAADVSILAAQYTEETDGFDSNQYDKDAEYDKITSTVSTAEDLVKAMQTNGTVILANDITTSELVAVPEGVTVTFDLRGYKLESKRDGYAIENKGTLTIYDSEGTGIVCHTGTEVASNYGHDAVRNFGTLTINGGTFGDTDTDRTNANPDNRGAAIRNQEGAVCTINGGYFTCGDNYWPWGTGTGFSYAIRNMGTMTITDADLYGAMNGGLASEEFGVTNISGGRFTVSGPKSYYVLVTGGLGEITITGGEFSKIGGNGDLLGGFSGMPSWDASEALEENRYYITGGTFIKDGEEVIF